MEGNNDNNKANNQEEEEGEENEDSLYQFFICEEYEEKSWHFQNVPEQLLLCSKMSCTDHDLTGQIVWPASVILSWFIDKNYHLFQGKMVLELGAGCGLGGIVASHFAKTVLLTDGNDIVLRLLQKNKEHLHLLNCEIVKLLWGTNSEVMKIQSNYQQFPDYIIGADVILWPNQLKSLLYTIRWLLFGRYYELQESSSSSTESVEKSAALPKAFISYVARANTTTELLFSLVRSMGFSLKQADNSTFIPTDCKTFDNLTFYLFEISLLEQTLLTGCDMLSEKQQEIEDQMNYSTLPC